MPYLTPKNDPLDTTCRPLQIPNDTEWLGIISGALTELVKLHNWEQSDGGITREQAVARVWAMINLYWNTDCVGGTTRRIFRISATGRIQFSDDIGETWEDGEGAIIPPLPPRPELTDDDKRCMAATNAANVLYQVYLELLDAFNTDSSIQFGIAAFAAILGLLLAALFAPVAVITALINFALGAFGYAYAAMGVLGVDDWTVAFDEDLICLLLEASAVTDGVVRFDFDYVRGKLFEIEAVNPTLVFWLFYILQVIGADGLNAAGATTGKTEGECAGCEDLWCYEWDFAAGMNDFTFKWCGGTQLYGVHDGNSVNQGTYGNQRILWLRKTWTPTEGVLVRVEIERDPLLGALGSLGIYNNNCSFTQVAFTQGETELHQVYAVNRSLLQGYVYLNWIKSTASPAGGIRKMRWYGTGTNPFGGDNC